MCAVFDKTPPTDRGKSNVRENERDYDDQSVYWKLISFYTESTNSRVITSTALSYIKLDKIESWKGTSEAFMLHWQNQIRVHEMLVSTNSHFSKHHKRIMLQNEVDYVGPLRSMKDQSDQNFSHSGREITHEKYSNLLLSADDNYDMQFTSPGSQSSQKVYVTDSNFLVIQFMISQKKA